MTPFRVSASQINDWLRCARSWHLKSVAHVPDDGNAGGKYLLAGNALDEAVQLHSAKLPLEVDDLAVRTAKSTRGNFGPAELLAAAELGISRLGRIRHLLPPPKTAQIQYSYHQAVPGYANPAVFVVGRPDLRQPGVITDTKTTSDRGPGRGAAADRPPYALTDPTTPGGNIHPLAKDVQAKLYAWVEFMLDPDRLSVRTDWVYVAKDTKAEWVVTHTFLRAETLSWFETVIRPVIDAMLAARELNDSHVLASSHEACQRCFVRNSCSPFAGAQTKENLVMALDLNRLRNRTAATPLVADPAPLVSQLEASVAVAINRPRPGVDGPAHPYDMGPPPAPYVVETTSTEAPAIALREELSELAPKDPPADSGVGATVSPSVEDAPTAPPKPARGRPRKAAAAVAAAAWPSPVRSAAADVEDLASAVQSMRDLCDRVIGDLDKRIATLLAQTKS